MKKLILALFLFFASIQSAHATTYYISTTGGGDFSGSSIANAINGTATNGANFRTSVEAASSGDVFRVVEGTYTFVANMFDIKVPLSIIV